MNFVVVGKLLDVFMNNVAKISRQLKKNIFFVMLKKDCFVLDFFNDFDIEVFTLM